MPDTKTHPVPDALIDALEAVLARWWSDERRDYKEWIAEDTPPPSPHIFTALEVIRRWLDYLEEERGRGWPAAPAHQLTPTPSTGSTRQNGHAP